MKLKYLFSILLFIILRVISFSQENVVNNLSAIDRLIDESFAPLNNKLLLLGRENFYEVSLEGNKAEHLYLIESIRKKFRDFNIIVNEDSDTIDFKLLLKNPKIKIKYLKIFTDGFFGTKKVEREVLVSYDLELIDKKTSLLVYSQKFNKKYKDNFGLDKLNFVEDNRYLFSQSILPEESPVNQFLYPAIIILSSAAAIILFFTIRSK